MGANTANTELKVATTGSQNIKLKLSLSADVVIMAHAPPYPPVAAPQTAPPTSLVTKVQLSIACKNLRDLDLLSKSDPQVVVSIFAANQWTQVYIIKT